ncbi:helix-turn-helix transcriptional regulator [Duganella violaceipulchra]|uniref:DNA-binding transcriptional regulator AlpA n=2 Tax=Duganella violaceipulchra TaxID=2849652 RepID=A0ABT1GYD6_9BURK|nr:helix-turn-helix domain-containing protein [Duganella violaceicalia]MCP2012578.1 putative DNA-binding transcriptional regulator AlpA [Duganella violaceicalia]
MRTLRQSPQADQDFSTLRALEPEAHMKPPPKPVSAKQRTDRTPMLYKITSVMELLEISHATVYRMVASGQLDLVKLSARSSRITSASVARILAQKGSKD